MRRRKIAPSASFSARLAIMESQERLARVPGHLQRAAAWAVLGLGLLPWVVLGNGVAAWSVMLVVGCLISVRIGGAFLEWGVPLFTGLCVYGGAASCEPRPWALGFAWIGLALACMLERPRLLRLAAAVGTGVSLSLVILVLHRPPWQAFSQRFVALCTGLALGVAAFVAARQLLHPSQGSRARLAMAVLSAAGLLATARQALWPPHNAWALPAWRLPLESLGPPPARAADFSDATLLGLDALRRVGAHDASNVWVAVALGQNATPQTLLEACPRLGWLGALPPSWKSWVEEGSEICQALHVWPEDAAASLERSSTPALQRLRGDILMDAGRVDRATLAYGRAAELGDSFAPAAQALALRARQRPVPPAVGAMARLWEQTQPFSGADWQAFNALRTFTSLAAPERAGMRLTPPQRLHTVYDADLQRRVLLSDTDIGVEISMPPGTVSARRIKLHIKRRGTLVVELRGAAGEVIRRVCDGTWEAPICAGAWAEVQFEVAEHFARGVQTITLGGTFALASIRGEL